MVKKGSKSGGKVKANGSAIRGNRDWGIGAVIVALFGTFLFLASLISRPQFIIEHHVVVLTQGIVAPAILMGSIVWAMVEFFTPPGTKIVDLLARIIPAFLVGSFLGGMLGYLFNFGQFIIEPAFNGNGGALTFLVSILVAGLAVMWNAAWSHRHGFRGQSGEGISPSGHQESGTSKGRRGIFALLIIFLVAVIIMPASAALGNAFISGHDNSQILQQESQVIYISGSSGPIPFGSINGTSTFDFPQNSTTVYLETNLTLGELNNFAVSRIVLGTSYPGQVNVTMGTGSNVSNFIPVVSANSSNTSSIAIAMAPQYLTGNQSSPVELKITASVTAMSVNLQSYGNNGLVTVFGPYPVEQTGYLIGTILMFAAAFLEISVWDLFPRKGAVS